MQGSRFIPYVFFSKLRIANASYPVRWVSVGPDQRLTQCTTLISPFLSHIRSQPLAKLK